MKKKSHKAPIQPATFAHIPNCHPKSTSRSIIGVSNFNKMNNYPYQPHPPPAQQQQPHPPPSHPHPPPSHPHPPPSHPHPPPSHPQQPIYQNYHQNQPQIYPQINPQIYQNVPINPQQQYPQQYQQQFPQQPYQQQQFPQQQQHSVTTTGYNRLWGTDSIDLLKQRHVLPPYGVKPPEIRHTNEFWRDKNVAPDIFRCTLTKIPETKALLSKSRLPLGILIHPFKDLTQLPVVQCSTIVRCRSCRTYINPFVYFIDQRRWKCNLCFRVNDLPDEFQYDPLTKTYGDPNRRPEVLSGTIEFLAPADYMVRPPQAAVYLFVMETSSTAIQSGYLKTVCDCLLENLEQLPGDTRSLIGFITYNSSVHFYDLSGERVKRMVVGDLDDVFVPVPEGLLVGVNDLGVGKLLRGLPGVFEGESDVGSCLGSAVKVAQKILSQLGGRITIFQHTLPTCGPGSLPTTPTIQTTPTTKDLNPSTDYYKKLALDCSSQYIAVDLFLTGPGHSDLASVGCVSKYSGGCVVRVNNLHEEGRMALLESAFARYLTRKIGFEAVMRVRCSRGLSIHTFHGNLFVRSTDLLSLPNCNPDAGFGMQVSIDEELKDFQSVAFQAALLYTSSRGERRIRVHTLCLPIASNINDIILSADQQAIVGLVAKMGVDRALTCSLDDAREAFVNCVVDVLGAYMTTQNSAGLALLAPSCLQMLPVYVHGLLRSTGFTLQQKPLDERVHFLNQLKSLPLYLLIQSIYPDLYRIDGVLVTPLIEHEQAEDEEPLELPNFPLLPLCSDQIEASGCYLLDTIEEIYIYVLRSCSQQFLNDVFACGNFSSLRETTELPELASISSSRVRNFVHFLQSNKPYSVPVRVLREDTGKRLKFTEKLVEDRDASSGKSYFEFIQQVKSFVK